MENSAGDSLEHDKANDEDPDSNKYKKKKSDKLSTWAALAILAYLLAIFGLVMYMDSRLPDPLGYKDLADNPGRFIEERARSSLKRITSVGARPAGRYGQYCNSSTLNFCP